MVDAVIQHEDQPQHGVFFIEQDGQRIAEMTYRRVSAALVVIDHTEVSPVLRGKGIARKLVDAAVQWARASQTKLTSTCSYASAIFARDASIRDVLG
jgi:uncharacterized protein